MNIGDVSFTARSTPPPGYLVADGDAVSRTTYSALFTLIGTTFGEGNGTTTFNLPDARGRVIAGQNIGANRLKNSRPGGVDADNIGATGGEETHLLTMGTEGNPGEVPVDGQLGQGQIVAAGNDFHDSVILNDVGLAHNNVQPCIVLLPIIYTGV